MPVVVPKIFGIVGVNYPSGSGATIKQFIILVTATLLCAALSWHFIEGPLNRFKRYFQYSKSKPVEDKAILGSMQTVLNSQ